MDRSDRFRDRTVLIAGAGCAVGGALAHAYARAGAHTILLDTDEAPLLDIARRHPGRIDTLELDCLRDSDRRRFTSIWEDEPVHTLVHLQLLENDARPGSAIASVVGLTTALAPALARVRGRVLTIFRGSHAAAPLVLRAIGPSMEGLAGLIAREYAAQEITSNAMQLGAEPDPAWESRWIAETALCLTAPDTVVPQGSVLRYAKPAD